MKNTCFLSEQCLLFVLRRKVSAITIKFEKNIIYSISQENLSSFSEKNNLIT